MPGIGETLREARVRQRVNIEELEQSTKIRAKYLRALENEEFGLLPGPTYVKSFLRTYAEKLGLDPQLLLEEFRAQLRAAERSSRSSRSVRAGRRAPAPPGAAVRTGPLRPGGGARGGGAGRLGLLSAGDEDGGGVARRPRRLRRNDPPRERAGPNRRRAEARRARGSLRSRPRTCASTAGAGRRCSSRARSTRRRRSAAGRSGSTSASASSELR